MFGEKENHGCEPDISKQNFQNHIFMSATDALEMKASIVLFSQIEIALINAVSLAKRYLCTFRKQEDRL